MPLIGEVAKMVRICSQHRPFSSARTMAELNIPTSSASRQKHSDEKMEIVDIDLDVLEVGQSVSPPGDGALTYERILGRPEYLQDTGRSGQSS